VEGASVIVRLPSGERIKARMGGRNLKPGDSAVVVVKADRAYLSEKAEEGCISGTVELSQFLGRDRLVLVRVGRERIPVYINPSEAVQEGASVYLCPEYDYTFAFSHDDVGSELLKEPL